MCSPLDTFCKADEWLTSKLTGMIESAWGMVHAAFVSTGLSDSAWSAATFFTNRFVAILMFATVAAAMVKIIMAMVRGRPKEVWPALLAAFLAWPVTATAVWLAIRFSAAIDKLTAAMLVDDKGSDALSRVFLAMTLLDKSVPFMDPTSISMKYSSSTFVFALLAMVIWVVSLVLTLVLQFRNFALLVLIAFAPVAWMLLPAETTRAWIKTWTQMTLALILAKPVAAVVLMLASEIMDRTSTEGWSAVLTGLVGLVVACASPAGTLALVRFAGVHTASEADGAATAGMRNTNRSAMKTYQGGRAAVRNVKTLAR